MGLFDFLNKNKSEDVSTLFTDENKGSCTSAADAYKKSRYGILKTDKMMLEEFFTDVKLLVEQKNMERSYCGMVQIGDDIIKYLPKIKDRLGRQLGYKVIVLDDNTVITNNVLNTKDLIQSGHTYLLLIWDKLSVEEVAEYNATHPVKDDDTDDTSTVDSLKQDDDTKKDETSDTTKKNTKQKKLNKK